ncbi:hypothetical protein CJ030_MR5G010132 [Morella rubra]|uniref:Uncharacterized protein n=1 Tax=Morella rubra TaxID=262757 RepID=A0A6A1VIT9_9ROSI|nr:hypothetical protein CJ030_MR5G010132 [Morella rubra]
MPAGGKRLRCDSSVRAESSPGTLAVSGPSLKDRNELPSPDTASPITTELRIVHCDVYDEHSVQDAQNRMFQHYSVFNSKEEALEHPYPEMNKEEWTRVCDLFTSEEFQRRSAINKENRAKLKIVHTSGARSFQRARALLKNPESDEISAALLYKKTHTNKDGMWTSEDARENFEKMEALQLQYESKGKSYTKYGADDARASADDGGAATEERRRADADDGRAATKKDEEHRKMMEEQQRTLVEQQERRMQLMAEQMREQLVEQIRQLQSRSTPK